MRQGIVINKVVAIQSSFIISSKARHDTACMLKQDPQNLKFILVNLMTSPSYTKSVDLRLRWRHGVPADFDQSKFVRATQEPLDLSKSTFWSKGLVTKSSHHIDGHDNIGGLIPWGKKHDRNLWNLANPGTSGNHCRERQSNIHKNQVKSVSTKIRDIHKILYCDHLQPHCSNNCLTCWRIMSSSSTKRILAAHGFLPSSYYIGS